MNFQQLKIIRETLRCQFNLTDVANALYTSQSGVSKHIKDLEDELGVELFIRKGKRILGLTEPGKAIESIVERMLLDAHNIKNIADQFCKQDRGELTIATTHTQARYALPPVVMAFKQAYPKVRLKLHQGSPAEIAQMLIDGEADVGVATETLGETAQLASFPYYTWHHGVLVPLEHPLVQIYPLTLEEIAQYPIITYHEGFTGRSHIEKTFHQAGFTPEIVLSALDADVIKAYVEIGLGVGIAASVAFDPQKDQRLCLLECQHLFAQNVTRIAVRRGHMLRQYALHFIQLCSPELTPELINAEIIT